MYNKKQALDVAAWYGAFANQSGPLTPSTAPQLTDTFINNMNEGYKRFGCKFLYNRRAVVQNTLSGLISNNSNPLWQQRLQSKLAYIDYLLNAYNCKEGEIPTLPCERIKPFCRDIRRLLNSTNTQALNNYLGMIAQQLNTTVDAIKDAYRRCCDDDGGTGVGDFSCDRVPKNLCAKFNTYRANNDQVGQNQIVSYLANMLQTTNQVAYSLLVRCCPDVISENPDIPCERVPRDFCVKFEAAIQSGSQAQVDAEINNFINFISSQGLGTLTYQQAGSLLRRCCRDNGTGTGTDYSDYPCERVSQEFCTMWRSAVMSNNQVAIDNVVNTFIANQIPGASYQVAYSILKRCCDLGPGTSTGTGFDDDIITMDDCRIECYQCQDGSPVGNKFDPIISSKADGSGYIYDCPKGWTSNTNPCGKPYTTSPVRPPVRPNFTDTFGNEVSPVRPPVRPNTGTTLTPIRDIDPPQGPMGGENPISSVSNNNMTTITPMRNFDGDTNGGMWLNDNY
mgnify:CR=1 FL=1